MPPHALSFRVCLSVTVVSPIEQTRGTEAPALSAAQLMNPPSTAILAAKTVAAEARMNEATVEMRMVVKVKMGGTTAQWAKLT